MFNREEWIKKAKEIAGKTAEFVSEKSDQVADYLEEKQFEIQMSAQIKEINDNLDELYCEYGKLMYLDATSLEERPAFESNMIKKLHGDITKLENKSARLVEELEEFVKAHEKSVEKDESECECDKPEETSYIFCTKCGKKHSEDEVFCFRCGSKLRRE